MKDYISAELALAIFIAMFLIIALALVGLSAYHEGFDSGYVQGFDYGFDSGYSETIRYVDSTLNCNPIVVEQFLVIENWNETCIMEQTSAFDDRATLRKQEAENPDLRRYE